MPEAPGLLAWPRRHKVLSGVVGVVLLVLLVSVLAPSGPARQDTDPAPLAGAPAEADEPDPTPSTPVASPSQDAPTEPAAPTPAPVLTQREVWLANYTANQTGYLAAVTATLATAPPVEQVARWATRACSEARDGLPLARRITRFGRRASSALTAEQGIAVLDTTVASVCPELAGFQAQQVDQRTREVEATRRAAAREARQAKAAAAEAARQAKAEQEAQEAQEARQEAAADVYYENCSDVEAAGAAPVYTGDPGYSRDLDRDGDGVACEG